MSLETAIAKLTAAVEANTAAHLNTGSAPTPVVASLPAAQTPAAPRTETASAADPLASIGSAAVSVMDDPAPPAPVDRTAVIDLAQQVGAQKGRAVLVELFAKFGADAFPKLKAADYPAFAEAAKAALK